MKYPQKALKEKIEDIEKVNFTIDKYGRVKNVTAILNNAKNRIKKKKLLGLPGIN